MLLQAIALATPSTRYTAGRTPPTENVLRGRFEKRAMDRATDRHLGQGVHILNLAVVIEFAVAGNGLGLEVLETILFGLAAPLNSAGRTPPSGNASVKVL